mgnify:CR=1 FL=1
MSDMELREDYQNNILVLGMLSDGPLEKFLKRLSSYQEDTVLFG